MAARDISFYLYQWQLLYQGNYQPVVPTTKTETMVRQRVKGPSAACCRPNPEFSLPWNHYLKQIQKIMHLSVAHNIICALVTSGVLYRSENACRSKQPPVISPTLLCLLKSTTNTYKGVGNQVNFDVGWAEPVLQQLGWWQTTTITLIQYLQD